MDFLITFSHTFQKFIFVMLNTVQGPASAKQVFRAGAQPQAYSFLRNRQALSVWLSACTFLLLFLVYVFSLFEIGFVYLAPTDLKFSVDQVGPWFTKICLLLFPECWD